MSMSDIAVKAINALHEKDPDVVRLFIYNNATKLRTLNSNLLQSLESYYCLKYQQCYCVDKHCKLAHHIDSCTVPLCFRQFINLQCDNCTSLHYGETIAQYAAKHQSKITFLNFISDAIKNKLLNVNLTYSGSSARFNRQRSIGYWIEAITLTTVPQLRHLDIPVDLCDTFVSPKFQKHSGQPQHYPQPNQPYQPQLSQPNQPQLSQPNQPRYYEQPGQSHISQLPPNQPYQAQPTLGNNTITKLPINYPFERIRLEHVYDADGRPTLVIHYV